MGGEPGRHVELAAELTKRWEDLWQVPTGSQVVLVLVPTGWGRDMVLDRFEEEIDAREDAPVTLTVRINGLDLRGETIGVQAESLRSSLAEAGFRSRVAELLGLDELSGQAQLG